MFACTVFVAPVAGGTNTVAYPRHEGGAGFRACRQATNQVIRILGSASLVATASVSVGFVNSSEEEVVMRRVQFLIVCAMVAGLVCAPPPAAGNDAPIRLIGGGPASKAGHKTVRMVFESVTMRLKRKTYSVDARFRFYNTGDTTTERVGFPKRGRAAPGTTLIPGDFLHFDTWVNGEKVSFSTERNLVRDVGRVLGCLFVPGASLLFEDTQYSDWLVKDVTFPGHSYTRTRVVHEVPYYLSNGPAAYYIYGTGSY
ncbi:MAG: hypothetical protein AB1646_00015 [Thermodesulfobacteriota bacterium]